MQPARAPDPDDLTDDVITFYHKPNCSTSQQALKLLKASTREPIEIVEYLVDVPTQKTLRELARLMGVKPVAMVRTKEPLYKEEYEGRKISGAEWIRILNQHPILIERPIVVRNGKALIARPVDRVIELLKK